MLVSQRHGKETGEYLPTSMKKRDEQVVKEKMIQ
jgi:hypothetical protein